MKFRDVAKWNIRVSAVYAVGIWTMIGSYAYYTYTGRYQPAKQVEAVQEPEDPNQVVHQTAYTKTVIIYKKDFVPYSTRIYNFINSFSSGSETGGSEK